MGMDAVTAGLSSAATWGSDGHNREAPKAEKALNYEEICHRAAKDNRQPTKDDDSAR